MSLDTSVMARGRLGAALAIAAVVVTSSGTEVLTVAGVERCEMRRNIRFISDLLLFVEEERVEVVRARSMWLQVRAEQNIFAMMRVCRERSALGRSENKAMQGSGIDERRRDQLS